MNQPRLFISSSQSDRSLTNRLADYLRRAYDEVWFDENRYGGEAWWDNVLWNIKACDIFLYLLSPASMRSPYCIAEYQEAQRLQKQIVLVAIRPPAPTDVQGLPLVDLTPGLTTAKIGELLALLRHLENRPPTPPPTPLSPTPTPVPVGDEPSTRRLPVKLVVLPLLLIGIVLAVGMLAPRVISLIATPTSTNTPAPSATNTLLPTSTPIPPTDTPVPLTATQLPSPTDTPTNTPEPPTPTQPPTPTTSDTPTATIPSATFTSTVPPTVTRRRPASGGK
ncbi:MAG: toll/interleukin-1 receptor domain-containing protein [Anaerolineae bacterium]|nr:toll/interleukin-1 receptor domain-containing protein [Anaerolineae bacterium]